MLSVVMTTYNHERYLAEAIESVLRQRTTFAVELVIGEDCSSDSTRSIAESYAESYPQLIRLLPSERNVGMRANYRRTIEATRGRYVAILDGDDYFTDCDKLQMQVELMERESDVGMCYTRSERIDEQGNVTTYPEGTCSESFEAMLWCNPAENATVVARRELVLRYYSEVEPERLHPEWLTDDLPMWIWFAATGRYRAIERTTAVHRILRSSVSHSPDYRRRIAFCDSMADISIWFDKNYNENRLHFELWRRRENTALWVLSYDGSIAEYVKRWWQGLCHAPKMVFNIAAYGLFIKKIGWRMWREK